MGRSLKLGPREAAVREVDSWFDWSQFEDKEIISQRSAATLSKMLCSSLAALAIVVIALTFAAKWVFRLEVFDGETSHSNVIKTSDASKYKVVLIGESIVSGVGDYSGVDIGGEPKTPRPTDARPQGIQASALRGNAQAADNGASSQSSAGSNSQAGSSNNDAKK